MRSFPTLRDAEIAYGQLEDRLAKIERKIVSPSSSSAAGDINITNVQESIDSILTGDGANVLHRLWHIFERGLKAKKIEVDLLEAIKVDADEVNAEKLVLEEPNSSGGPTWVWSPFADILALDYVDPTLTKVFVFRFLAGSTEALSKITFKGTIAEQANRVAQIYVQNLSVLPGGLASSVGQVLTAADTFGSCQWVTPAVVSPPFIEVAYASTTLTLNTIFTDVPGCSIALGNPGIFEVIACPSVIFQVNDSAIEIGIQQNGGGSMVQSGDLLKLSKDPAANMLIGTSRAWKLDLTGAFNPLMSVKLVARKTGGTGISALESTHTSIIAKRIK